MLRFCIGVIVGIFIEQNFTVPNLRECSLRIMRELENHKKPPRDP